MSEKATASGGGCINLLANFTMIAILIAGWFWSKGIGPQQVMGLGIDLAAKVSWLLAPLIFILPVAVVGWIFYSDRRG